MNLGDALWVFLTSAAPVSELRGGIPLALFEFDFTWYNAFWIAFLGNLFPVPLLLIFLEPLSRLLSRIKLMGRILNWIFERSRQRGRIIEKYGKIGLVLLVAIPLPMTGAWTGSIAAFLLGIRFKHAFLPILTGILIAGIIVTAICVAGWQGYLWLD